MLWLKVLFIIFIFISQIYVIYSQPIDKGESKMQYNTMNMLLIVLYIGISELIIFHLVDIISAEFFPTLLLYFILLLSVVGSLFILIARRRKKA
ncbi:hypothetical protein BK781_17365 [Bacillus thuringiensis serovar aizawai]|nr:hypothetical protein BK781_17365 [Bacillus thuringiensis serovar aizawai]